MSYYEVIITCVALTNLALAIVTGISTRAKATSSKLAELDAALRQEIKGLGIDVNELRVATQNSLNHEHLAEVYGDLKGIAEQVHILVGQQAQMNELLRQLLAQQLRH